MKASSPLLLAITGWLVACGGSQTPASSQASGMNGDAAATSASAGAPATPMASLAGVAASGPIEASIEPRSGSKAEGKVTLNTTEAGVRVVIQVSGIAPGAHGLHFHETGDCSAPDAMSAKAHFNPTEHHHGLMNDNERHLGDLGNIDVGADGRGHLEMTLPQATLQPQAPNSLRGRALILHEKTDDGSQPAGNSGARIGCAVIP